jgi:DNA-binding Lrp family transcriptional regulator
MNKTERNIAKILVQNARMPFSQLAKIQKISNSQAKRIYLKLRRTIFKNQTITVDLQKLGYQATVDILIKIQSGQNIDELIKKVLKIPNIISLYKIVNMDAFYVGSPIKTLYGFFKIKETLLQLDEIRSAECTISKIIPSWPANIFSLFL